MRKWMRSGGSDYQPMLRCKFCQLSAKCSDFASRLPGITANRGTDFHNRLVHFRFDLLLQNHFTVGENLLDLRPEFARFRIDELQFFLDPESENVIGSPKSRRRFLYFARGVLLSRGNIHRSSAESMVIVTCVLGTDSAAFAIY